jgi:hypothetical protein
MEVIHFKLRRNTLLRRASRSLKFASHSKLKVHSPIQQITIVRSTTISASHSLVPPYPHSRHSLSSQLLYGLGTCSVLLTIKHPCNTNMNTTGWNASADPSIHKPSGICSSVQPLYTQYAIICTLIRDMGIGVPSKYWDLPVASLGTMATVTLKRARRVRPQRTKKVSRMWSTGVRRPMEKAAAAGPTPNEIWECC